MAFSVVDDVALTALVVAGDDVANSAAVVEFTRRLGVLEVVLAFVGILDDLLVVGVEVSSAGVAFVILLVLAWVATFSPSSSTFLAAVGSFFLESVATFFLAPWLRPNGVTVTSLRAEESAGLRIGVCQIRANDRENGARKRSVLVP